MSEWTAPTIIDVARHLPTRTKNTMGVVQRDDDGNRTFNEDTVPTVAEVEGIIADAVTVIESDVGKEFCDVTEAEGFPVKATSLSALYAAMQIELGYFPEQVNRQQSPYPELKKLYDERRKGLRSEVKEVCGDVPGTDEGETGAGALPNYNFDVSTKPLGREIVW